MKRLYNRLCQDLRDAMVDIEYQFTRIPYDELTEEDFIDLTIMIKELRKLRWKKLSST